MPLTKLDMGTWNTVMHVTENLETYHLHMKHMQHQLKLQSAFFNFSDEKKVFGTYLCWPAVPRTATNKEHANVYAFVSRNKSIHVGELIFPSSLQLYFINSHLPPSFQEFATR